MASRPDQIHVLIADIERLIAAANTFAAKYDKQVERVHPKYRDSALNLLHYSAMRTRDLSRIQKKLRNMGLSRLAKAESHVMPSLLTTKSILQALAHEETSVFEPPDLSIRKSKRRLKKHVRRLLGRRPKRRESRIMVTMPSDAAYDVELLRKMMESGMNVARINCAHDGPDTWLAIIKNIRALSVELEKPCAITMDLAGPKIRTGPIEGGPRVRKIRPKKNVRGQIIEPARVWFGETNEENHPLWIPVEDASLLSRGGEVHFRDARNKRRTVKFEKRKGSKNGCWGLVPKTTFFETGMIIYHETQLIHPIFTVAELPSVEGSIYLTKGDYLRIEKEHLLAKHRSMGDEPELPLAIHCSNSAVLSQAKEGEPVMLDDGKFEGTIVAKDKKGLTLEMTTVRNGGAKLRADKGINFPKSKLTIQGLTEKDRVDLKFVVQHADAVNMSFVNSPQDVNDLLEALDDAGASSKLGVILKIETRRAFKNMLNILLAGMQTYPLGVMIARGDLAIEVGWKRIAVVQREIMKLCHAAHVPDIWATQVFETLAKTGVPSRAEMTDVWVAQRSECVMLNKGPYIVEAIQLLDTILTRLDIYHDKDSALLPSLKKVED